MHVGVKIKNIVFNVANFPPNISGPGKFKLFVGQEAVYNFTVSDEGDTFTLTVNASAPEKSLLVDLGNGTYSFRWTVQDIANLSLSLIATDSAGTSSQLVPQLEVCGCVNGGQCTLDGVLDTVAPVVVLACVCSEGIYTYIYVHLAKCIYTNYSAYNKDI